MECSDTRDSPIYECVFDCMCAYMCVWVCSRFCGAFRPPSRQRCNISNQHHRVTHVITGAGSMRCGAPPPSNTTAGFGLRNDGCHTPQRTHTHTASSRHILIHTINSMRLFSRAHTNTQHELGQFPMCQVARCADLQLPKSVMLMAADNVGARKRLKGCTILRTATAFCRTGKSDGTKTCLCCGI